jgi:transmembrane protein TMEM260 (protein O-mannosyltransferase)
MTVTPSPRREPPPYPFAGLIALVIFGLYLVTLAPTTAFWDTSEYIAAAYTLGIPHPPGNPLFTVLAHTWGALPLDRLYAVRINLFAAATSAAASGLWFLVADRWMREVVPVRWARLAASAAGVLVGATSWTVWNQSTVNEKVYTVSLLSTALVLWVGVHWADDDPGPHRDRWLVLIAYLIALNSTNHMMGVLAAPAVAMYVLLTDPALLLRPWVLWLGLSLGLAVSGQWAVLVSGPPVAQGALGLAIVLLTVYTAIRDASEFRRPILYLGILAVAVGVSLNYAFLPIRAGQFPAINEGEPTNWHALVDVLGRKQYGKPSVFLRQADFASQIGNYFQYFRWQFARDWGELGMRLGALIFSLLGLWGAASLWRRDRRAFWASATLMFTLTLALIFYLNFKYGWSYPVDPARGQVAREVRERDYFFLISFASFGLWVAVGFGAALRAIAEGLSHGAPTLRWGAGLPVLCVALMPLMGNRVTAPRSNETMARDFAIDLLQSVEPYAILITAGDNDTFPLWYAQEVEHVRPDVTLANLSLMNTTWHLKQMRRRPIPDFDPAGSIALWRNHQWPKPATPVLSLTEEMIDSLPEAQQVPKNGGIRFDSLTIAFGQDVLFLSDIATIFLIRDNLGHRPIYFAWSAGGYPDQTLGLTNYLVTEGLVRRLNPTPVKDGDGIVRTRGLGYLDLARTRFLLDSTYHWQTVARNRPTGWVDKPSASILNLYGVVYGAASTSFREAGDSVLAAKADSIAEAVDAQVTR